MLTALAKSCNIACLCTCAQRVHNSWKHEDNRFDETRADMASVPFYLPVMFAIFDVAERRGSEFSSTLTSSAAVCLSWMAWDFRTPTPPRPPLHLWYIFWATCMTKGYWARPRLTSGSEVHDTFGAPNRFLDVWCWSFPREPWWKNRAPIWTLDDVETRWLCRK